MKITDENFDFTKGKKYNCDGNLYTVLGGNIYLVKGTEYTLYKCGTTALEIISVRELQNMDFEPFVEWSKVPVDTKVEVSSDGIKWFKRHFDSFDKGLVYAFADGRTSYTQYEEGITSHGFKHARLYEGE